MNVKQYLWNQSGVLRTEKHIVGQGHLIMPLNGENRSLLTVERV